MLAIYLLSIAGHALAPIFHGGLKEIDFLAFWAAGRLALEGQATAAFDWRSLAATFEAEIGPVDFAYGWFYPPTMQLLMMPFAAMPFFVAYTLWVGVTLAAFAGGLWRLFGERQIVWLVLAAPVVWANIKLGQTGMFIAAAMILGFCLRRQSSWMAGLCFALISVKPHMGVLLPIVFLVSGWYRLFAATAFWVLVWALAAFAVLGAEPWLLFFDGLRNAAGEALATGLLKTQFMITPFAFALGSGATLEMATTLQLCWVALVVLATIGIWRKPLARDLKLAWVFAAAATLSPYAYIYDATLAATASLLLLRHSATGGHHDQDRALALHALFHAMPFLLLLVPPGVGMAPAFLGVLALIGHLLVHLRKDMATVRLKPV